jgi:hypothetical protein
MKINLISLIPILIGLSAIMLYNYFEMNGNLTYMVNIICAILIFISLGFSITIIIIWILKSN